MALFYNKVSKKTGQILEIICPFSKSFIYFVLFCQFSLILLFLLNISNWLFPLRDLHLLVFHVKVKVIGWLAFEFWPRWLFVGACLSSLGRIFIFNFIFMPISRIFILFVSFFMISYVTFLIQKKKETYFNLFFFSLNMSLNMLTEKKSLLFLKLFVLVYIKILSFTSV